MFAQKVANQSWGADPSCLVPRDPSVRWEMSCEISAFCMWAMLASLSWFQRNHEPETFPYPWRVILKPHIFNTCPLFPDPKRWLAVPQVGGSTHKANIATGFATLHLSLDSILLTSGPGSTPCLNRSPPRRSVSPHSHEDHRRCHGDVVPDDGARGCEAAERLQPVKGTLRRAFLNVNVLDLSKVLLQASSLFVVWCLFVGNTLYWCVHGQSLRAPTLETT